MKNARNTVIRIFTIIASRRKHGLKSPQTVNSHHLTPLNPSMAPSSETDSSFLATTAGKRKTSSSGNLLSTPFNGCSRNREGSVPLSDKELACSTLKKIRFCTSEGIRMGIIQIRSISTTSTPSLGISARAAISILSRREPRHQWSISTAKSIFSEVSTKDLRDQKS